MNYENLTVEKLAEYCCSKSGFKINKADLETQIQYLIDRQVSKQLKLHVVSKRSELLNFIFKKHYKETGYIDLRIEEANALLEKFNCG